MGKINSLSERIRRYKLGRILVIGYYDSFKDRVDKYINEQTKHINEKYDNKLECVNTLLAGKTTNEIKREELLIKYDKKFYWKKRAYKQTLIRKNEDDIDLKLASFDNQVLNQKNDYTNLLLEKYPNNPTDINELTNKKVLLENKKAESIKQMMLKHQDLVNKLNSLKLKTDDKVAKIDQNVSTLTAKLNVLLDSELKFKTESLKNPNLPTKKQRNYQTYIELLENNDNILEVKELKMFFGGIKAINDLSFSVKKGEIFGLIGPNGAGKTTVFNCITQFYKPTDGEIFFRNKQNNVVDLNKLHTYDMIKQGIARSFQNIELIWELSVLDNLLVAAHSLFISNFIDDLIRSPRLRREERILRFKGYNILKMLKIEDVAFRSPYGLPYGILKKVELARTLMADPSIIILDEPAAGLNDAETIELANVIKQINQELGVTIFLVEHDMGLVMSICDTICAISFGKLLALGTPKEIQNSPEVRKAYLGDDDDE